MPRTVDGPEPAPVDPDNHLRETDESDNQSWTVVEISGGGTQAQIVI